MTAAMGMTSMIAARRMSLTTITSLWSQRSTNVPAIGLRSRFGSMAAKKTRPVANTDPVAVATTATSASWLSRSPNSEMSWPAQSAENEPLRASRTYGCWRTRSTASGDGRGIGIVTVSGGAAVRVRSRGEPARPRPRPGWRRRCPWRSVADGRPADRMSARGRSRSPRHRAAAAIVGATRPDAPGSPRGLPPRAPAARERPRRTGRTPDRGSGRHRRSMPRSG